MEKPNHLLPTEQQCESFTKKQIKLCLVGNNNTGKTTRIEQFLQTLSVDKVFYATDLIDRINDREEYKRFLIHNYLPEMPTYLFIKQGDEEVLRVIKERLIGKQISSDNLIDILNHLEEEQDNLEHAIQEASMVLSLFDGIVPPEKTIAELKGEFIKAARVGLLVEAIKAAQAKSNKQPLEALSYVLRMLGTKETLMTLPSKEKAWSTLQTCVENSAIYEVCQGAYAQTEEAKRRLSLNKKCQNHMMHIVYELLKQRVDDRLLKLKPKSESVKQLTQACRLLVQLPAIDALVIDHVAWDAKTLSTFMENISEAACSVFITSTISPQPVEGWILASTR